jgi:hypothetical protein
MDKTSLTLGWLVGRRIAGQRTKQKTIIGYSYNGVVLPTLPEWDKETYPYAVMTTNTQGGVVTSVRIVAYSEPMHLVLNTASVGSSYYLGVKAGNPFLTTGAWYFISHPTAEFTEKTLSYDYLYTDEPHWANYDVLDKDGSVYLAASDPIPVYE